MRCRCGEENRRVELSSYGRLSTGTFTDHGKMFRSNEIGVQNSIDPSFLQYEGETIWYGEASGEYMLLS